MFEELLATRFPREEIKSATTLPPGLHDGRQQLSLFSEEDTP